MRRDIVFVHIPKTAGTSLRLALAKAAVNHVVLWDYDFEPATTPALLELVHRQRRLPEFRRRFNRPDRGILLSGHFPARRYWDFFNPESFVTFIRNPVDRVLSEYNHFINYQGWKGTVEEFVALPRFRNLMSRVLSNVDLAAFGFIGIMEDFDRCVGELRDFVGAQLPSLNVNRGDYRQQNGVDIRSQSDIRARIADLNRNDLDLYERLAAARSKACRAFGDQPRPAGEYRGSVDVTKEGVIRGWVCNTTREFICDVEIWQDDRLLRRVKADRYRPDIKKEGISRSGVCAFGFGRPALSAMGADCQGTLAFKVRDTDYELQGSPLRLTENPVAAQS